jgi:hypothetical protein
VQTPLQPAIESGQITPVRPARWDSLPAVELLVENLAAQFFQILAGVFLVLTLWKQVDRRFSPKMFQTQAATRRICAMQPIQDWLDRHHNDRCPVGCEHPVSA